MREKESLLVLRGTSSHNTYTQHFILYTYYPILIFMNVLFNYYNLAILVITLHYNSYNIIGISH